MSSLVLHLHGPMQSWGIDAHSNTRPTEHVPTKSALTGLLASALGRRRGSDVSDIAALQLVVRVDRVGWEMRDYHTVGAGYPKGGRISMAEGKEREESVATLVSNRFYLADAAFTVAMSGEDDFVAALHEAIRHPCWAPALGRRSCPPAEPFVLGVIDVDPVIYLRDELPVVRDTRVFGTSVLFVADDATGAALTIKDMPTAALNQQGTYGVRRVRRWNEVMDEARFVSDPLTLVAEGVGADG